MRFLLAILLLAGCAPSINDAIGPDGVRCQAEITMPARDQVTVTVRIFDCHTKDGREVRVETMLGTR